MNNNNGRERVLNVLKGQKICPPPWIPLMSRTYFRGITEYDRKFPFMKWWFLDEPNIPDEFLAEELEFRVKFYRNIGADFMLWGGDCFKPVWSKVEKRRYNTETSLFIEYKTPIGELWQEFEYSPKSNSCYKKNYLMKNKDDLRVYRYIVEDISYEPNYKLAEMYLNIVKNDGVFFAHGVAVPMHDLLNKGLGPEQTYFAVSDNLNEVQQIIDMHQAKNIELAKIMAGSPYQIFLHQCLWDVGVISPVFYKEFYLPYLKEYNRLLHNENKTCLDHSSGQDISPYTELIEDSEFDGITGFAYPEKLCNISLPALTKKWKNRITCIGGLDPHYLATSTKMQIKERTREILNVMRGDQNFILSVADDTVYTTPIENIFAVSEVLNSWTVN